MKPFLLLLALCGLPAAVTAQVMRPGVTVWVYDVSGTLNELPVVAAGQTPNVAGDHPNIDFTSPWQPPSGSDDPLIAESYIGLAWGWLTIPSAGTYEFRLTADDGARFYFNRDRAYHPLTNPDPNLSAGAIVVDDNQPGPSSATGSIQGVTAGTYPITVESYQDAGASRLLLEWKKPGDADFSPVPESALETEDEQTHVFSSGYKNWSYANGSGGTAGGPGDGSQLTGVHPSFTFGTVMPYGSDFTPAGQFFGIGGMDFLPDGRMVVSTWTPDGSNYGAVYIVDNYQDGNPSTTTFTKFAEGLGEALGLKVINGEIYVTQKREITKLVDTDGDDWCDEYIAISHGWPMSPNYHEFNFNLVQKDGFLWCTTSVPLKTADTAYTPTLLPADAPHLPSPLGSGGLIKVDPATGAWEIVATGLRTPNGMGLGPEGEMFGSDNQGGWLPASLMRHYREGANHEHQAKLNGTAEWARPVLWLEHNKISLSASQPALIPSGTYAGQMVIGEVTQGGARRANLEKVNGVWQGCAFHFTQGLGVGINRLVWGPDGALYLGGAGSNGNWAFNTTKYGLQQMKPNGLTTFEYLHVKSRAEGFEVAFTQSVPFAILSNPANYEVSMWRNVPSAGYGAGQAQGGKIPLTVTDVIVSADRRKVQLTIPGLLKDRCVYLRLKNFKNDSGVSPWVTEAWYTLNEISSEVGPTFESTPVNPEGAPPVGATVLFDGTGTSEWEKDASPTGAIEWTITPEGYLQVDRTKASIRTVRDFTDYRLHLEWRSPSGGTGQNAGNSGVKLAQRYEIQILNNPGSVPIATYPLDFAGSIYLQKKPDVNASLGPDQWQNYDIWFTAPRWSGNVKTANARITAFWNGVLVHNDVEVTPTGSSSPAEIPGTFPVMLQSHSSGATGEVAFRNVWLVPGSDYPPDYTFWAAINSLAGPDAAANADPDKDGIPNAWEYVTRSNPNQPALSDASGPLLPQFSHVQGQGYRFTVRRRTDHAALGLQFLVEGSPNLGANSWDPVPFTIPEAPVPAGDGETEFVTLEFEAPAEPTMFFRVGLRVTP